MTDRVSIEYGNKQFKFRKHNLRPSVIKRAFGLDFEFEIMLHNPEQNFVEFPDENGYYLPLELDYYQVIVLQTGTYIF